MPSTDPTTSPTPEPTTAPTTPMDVMLAQLRLVGIDPEDLAAYAAGQTAGGVTTGAFLADRVVPTLTKGMRDAWRSYIPVITEGLPGLCRCHCPACLAFVERAFGHAVAQGWLRHHVDDVTGLHTMANPEAIEDAHRWLVGEG